jgi:hypothetical protein
MNLKYIPSKALISFLGLQKIQDVQNLSLSLSKLEQNYTLGEQLIQDQHTFSFGEIEAFLKIIQGDEQLIFIQWIEGSPNLFSSICSKIQVKNDFLIENYKEHFLFQKFKSFVSQFLFPNLIFYLERKNIVELSLIASYIPILDRETAFLLQDKIHKIFKNDWQQIQEKIKQTSTEKQLLYDLSGFFSDSKMECLNHFTKEFYHVKIELIEQGIELFNHKATTNRFAFWLIKQLKKMSLNQEHQQKLKDIYTSIKNGDGRYFKRISLVSNAFNYKKILILSSGIALIFFLVFLFIEKSKFTEETNPDSAFTHFSKEERMHMDSIIQTMKKKTNQDEEKFDSGKSYLHLSQVNIELKNRIEFQNISLENFIKNEIKLQEIIAQNEIDSCRNISNKSLNSINLYDFKPLRKHIANKKMYFKNESSYQVLILNFKNSTSESVNFHLLNPNEEFEFFCQTGSEFLFLPGNNFGKIFVNQNEIKELSNQYHFCYTDQNYDAQLMLSYKLKHASQETIKVLFNQTKYKEFYILDLYEALEN